MVQLDRLASKCQQSDGRGAEARDRLRLGASHYRLKEDMCSVEVWLIPQSLIGLLQRILVTSTPREQSE